MAGGDEGDFDCSDFSDIVSVATDELKGGVRGTLTATEIGKWIFLVNPGFSESLHFPLSLFNLIRVRITAT